MALEGVGYTGRPDCAAGFGAGEVGFGGSFLGRDLVREPLRVDPVPALDIPVCGRETSKVEIYSPEILRDGQVDGSRIKGTGRWGYVFTDERIVVFVDCLKPSLRGVPWYQERGVY